jgi:hypothetical protein
MAMLRLRTLLHKIEKASSMQQADGIVRMKS